jgi:hypothetical protein
MNFAAVGWIGLWSDVPMPMKVGTVEHMKKLLSPTRIHTAVVALTLVIAFAGIARTAFASPQQKETMLQQAGFKVHTVTTDRQREHLQALPEGQISIVQHNGKTFYAFPDAAHNQIYTGNQAQFQAFKQAQLQASRQSSGLNVNPDPHGIRINEFDGWGPGPLASTDGY